ncbi:glycerophosphodiester phosphodiesterase [Haloferax sp. Atlit-6N]|uniref:glycerophosphodiester phosphodiesterase n=1 Tax=Haloferax sp. Atlit-6N TaxID=2077205 RepID=UPI000E233691|nr:glycerophosphodiester phosphodiesterase [Haloferax sp. Atlit-6N]REA02772.1 glycerophosphodiester phosphodiesterase [Haloferax sp. Atlit-6N]
MLTIGHRGCAGQYPENTIPAVKQSAPHVDLVEVDVMRCGSGELVAFHDDDLSRLTTVSGKLAETAVDDLTALRVGGSEATIPRFERVVDEWPAGTGMNLDTRDPGLVEDALAAVETLDERVVFSSPSREAVGIALETPSAADIGYSFRDEVSAELAWTTERGCDFVHVEHGLCTSTDLVERAHDAGLLVDAWTVDDESTATTLQSVGVDALTVDRWDVVTTGPCP